MKLFKKPVFAALICFILVVASTLISVNIKFGSECRAITNLFYDGMVYNGQQQYGIAKHLKDIYTACDSINAIAEYYNVSDDDFRYRSEDLRLSLTYSPDDASYIYHCYDELLQELRRLENDLSAVELKAEDDAEIRELIAIIDESKEMIAQSGYNEAVRDFLRGVPEFPTEELADLADIELPEYFG